MSKNIKRLFLVVIIACLSVFTLSSCSGGGDDKPLGEHTPTPVSTEEPAPQEGRIKKVSKRGKCGDRLNWEYGDDNALVIYGTGEMQNYGTEEGALPQWVYLDIKRIDVLDGATSIGDFAFYGMENVSEIKIAKSVTKSGYDAFEGTGWLNNKEDSFVVLGDGVLVKYKGASPQVTIPHGVKYISNAFDEYLLIEFLTPEGVWNQDSKSEYPSIRSKTYTSPGVRILHVDARLITHDDEITTSMDNKHLYAHAYSNTPSESYSAGTRTLRNDLLALVSADNDSRFQTNEQEVANNSSLFKNGMTFDIADYNSFFKNAKLHNGETIPYEITIKNITNESATISFETK
jgi:hypothetical protein